MICFIYSFSFLFLSIIRFLLSLNFMVLDYVIFLEYSLFSINSSMVVMTIILDWMSLLFMSFVLFIFSMVIHYSNEYMHGDLNFKSFYFIGSFICFIYSFINYFS